MFATDTRPGLTGTRIYVLIVLLLMAIYAQFVVQNYTGLMIGYTDVNIHAYQGYYIQKYLHFVPWPQLDLNNDALLYPYGNDQVFQSWVFERDLFSALCLTLIGAGPWVQLHYLFSVLTIALGLFFLLRREHSPLRAAFAGLAVAFCNYYAISKFPGHANLCVLHWSLLGITVDYLISRRLARCEFPSGRLILLRATLIFLALGQEMGYVAGLSLSSFVLTAVWSVVLLFINRRRMTGAWRGIPGNVVRDLVTHPGQTAALLFGLAWGAFFYFPLALEIYTHAKKYPIKEILNGTWWQWANPLRLFLPIIPGLEPISTPGNFERSIDYFKDDPEAIFAMSPGLFFVLLGATGVFLAIRKRAFLALVPILVLWLMVVANHPAKFPTMSVFPWFAYVRTTAKLGNLNCLALVLLGIGGVPAGYFFGGRRSDLAPGARPPWLFARLLVLGFLALLLMVETVTAYSLELFRDRHYFKPDKSFYAYMETVRRTPGEALFEWPFCVASGNGIGTYFFGLYFDKQSTLFCWSMFHQKKVPSGYYGRLFPQQITPFFHAGWDDMFFPGTRDLQQARCQIRDFDPAEWKFFEEFFRKNDFCGLQLSTDFLPEATVKQMHARFGEPVAVTTGGSNGRMEFIPRPPAWGRPANPEEGKSVVLMGPLTLPVTHVDFTKNAARDYLREGWSDTDNSPRFSDGHLARVVFEAPAGMAPRPLTLDLFANTFEVQRFTLKFNGRMVKTFEPPTAERRHFVVDLPADAWRSGANELTFELPQAHLPPPPTNPGQVQDPRALGLQVEFMDLRETAKP